MLRSEAERRNAFFERRVEVGSRYERTVVDLMQQRGWLVLFGRDCREHDEREVPRLIACVELGSIVVLVLLLCHRAETRRSEVKRESRTSTSENRQRVEMGRTSMTPPHGLLGRNIGGTLRGRPSAGTPTASQRERR